MDTYKRNELLIGLAMLGAGLGYLFLTLGLPRRGFIDAAFVPCVLSGALCLLGALQLIAWKKLPNKSAQPTEETDPIDYPTVFKSLALVLLYIGLLETVGFPIITAVYLYAQFIVLTPSEQKVNHLLYVVIAVVSSSLIFITFRQGFDLLLPAGLMSF
ncbi:MAG: tripartite tricarboxylate transporter TctB family protein [Pseudomonas sp.]